MRIAVQYPVVLLLIPVIIAVMLVTSRSLRIGNKVRKCFITGIRIVLFSLIICAMADISVNVSSRNTGTVFLLDVSESFAANKEEAVGSRSKVTLQEDNSMRSHEEMWLPFAK